MQDWAMTRLRSMQHKASLSTRGHMRTLTIAIGTRDSGQAGFLSAAKQAKGKAIRCLSFWDSPFDLTKTNMFAKLTTSLIELKCSTVRHFVWDLSWLELTAMAQIMHYPADRVGYESLVADLLAFDGQIRFVHLQSSDLWLDNRLDLNRLSEYWRNAERHRQQTEDMAVLTHIESGLATITSTLRNCTFDTIQFANDGELHQKATALFN